MNYIVTADFWVWRHHANFDPEHEVATYYFQFGRYLCRVGWLQEEPSARLARTCLKGTLERPSLQLSAPGWRYLAHGRIPLHSVPP